jgi:hypothetical protein
MIPALAPAELQMAEKTAGAKAQHDFVALPARLKSCPDTKQATFEFFRSL